MSFSKKVGFFCMFMAQKQGSVADPGISKPGARSRRGRFLRSGVCFDALSRIPYVFVVRVVNKIQIVNIVNWQKSKYKLVSPLQFTNTNPKTFSKQGVRARPAGSGSAFGGGGFYVIEHGLMNKHSVYAAL